MTSTEIIPWNKKPLSHSTADKISGCPECARLSKTLKRESYFLHIVHVSKYVHTLIEQAGSNGPETLIDFSLIFQNIDEIVKHNIKEKKRIGSNARDMALDKLKALAKMYLTHVHEQELYFGIMEYKIEHKMKGLDEHGELLLNGNGKKMAVKGKPLELDFLGYVDRISVRADGSMIAPWDWKLFQKKSPKVNPSHVSQLKRYCLCLHELGLIRLPAPAYLLYGYPVDPKFTDSPFQMQLHSFEFEIEELMVAKRQLFYIDVIRRKGLSVANHYYEYCKYCDYKDVCSIGDCII